MSKPEGGLLDEELGQERVGYAPGWGTVNSSPGSDCQLSPSLLRHLEEFLGEHLVGRTRDVVHGTFENS